jgi:hypothetical protein
MYYSYLNYLDYFNILIYKEAIKALNYNLRNCNFRYRVSNYLFNL